MPSLAQTIGAAEESIRATLWPFLLQYTLVMLYVVWV